MPTTNKNTIKSRTYFHCGPQKNNTHTHTHTQYTSINDAAAAFSERDFEELCHASKINRSSVQCYLQLVFDDTLTHLEHTPRAYVWSQL